MVLGLLTLEVHLPGCSSLKEKRSRLKPLLARLHREFNVSTAEIGKNDAWQSATLACALVSNDPAFTQSALQKVLHWIQNEWPDVALVDDRIDLF